MQANGWSGTGEFGTSDPATETKFQTVWQRHIRRGLQAIQPGDQDWVNAYGLLRRDEATYAEVYAGSFSSSARDTLRQQMQSFAADCRG